MIAFPKKKDPDAIPSDVVEEWIESLDILQPRLAKRPESGDNDIREGQVNLICNLLLELPDFKAQVSEAIEAVVEGFESAAGDDWEFIGWMVEYSDDGDALEVSLKRYYKEP